MSAEPAPRILVIEDERPMRVALHDCLLNAGYRVLTADDGESGLQKALHEKPDLLLLDIMMPRLDGFALCKELRRLNQLTPVLCLTAKAQTADKVAGLDSGADDYLVKPFSSEELLARVRALLRRRREARPALQQIQIGACQFDFEKLAATRAGEPLRLTAKEFSMLRLLVEAEGQPVTRQRFLDLVWGYTAFPTTRTVDNHIASLRAKIEADPDSPRHIQTVHGVGYKLTKP